MRISSWSAVLAALTLAATDARGDLFRDLGYALGYVGFGIQGNENRLSGGFDIRISRNLLGNELDFGAGDLTMQGPVSLELSVGGRELSEIELSFATALTGNDPATPLSYVFNYDAGSQATKAEGTLLADGRLALNEFGYYDIDLTYSSRQTVSNEGRFDDGTRTYDSDVGPINVSGNFVADALALVTDPIFDKAGYVNFFASFSGESSISSLLLAPQGSAQEQAANGSDPVEEEQAKLLGGSFLGSPVAVMPAAAALNQGQAPSSAWGGSAVPEPAVLLLMLLGLPVILTRRPRRRDPR